MSLNHQGSVVLQTPRLLLRPVTAGDAPELFACCLSDAQVTRYISIPTHSGVGDTAALLQKAIGSYEQPSFYYWAIVPRQSGLIAGIMLVVGVDERSCKCEVGYYLRRDLWGQGLTGEALAAVVDFLFGRVGFVRLEARCDTANAASGRVLEKCGFMFEGCMRQSFFSNEGEYVDSNFYGLLREDWQRK